LRGFYSERLCALVVSPIYKFRRVFYAENGAENRTKQGQKKEEKQQKGGTGMSATITINLAQAVGWGLTLCAGVSCVAAAANWVMKGLHAADKPRQTQNERLKRLEETTAQHAEDLAHDRRRLMEIEEGDRVTQQAILALLGHSINGEAMDELKAARLELQKYLIERGAPWLNSEESTERTQPMPNKWKEKRGDR
jgi:hypothetical protein